MSGGFLSEMNARMRANLGMRKRGGYFRDARETFVNPIKYKKGKPPAKPAPEELQQIRERAAAIARKDKQQLHKHVWISAIIFVIIIVIGMATYSWLA